MKIPFTLRDFSGGMKGKKGQFNQAKIENLQDITNFVVERNGTLKQRNGIEELPFTLLKYDKLLPFEFNGRKFYFVYDPLLNLKYAPYQAGTLTSKFPKSMGGRRFVDVFSRVNSSLYPLGYLKKEATNHTKLTQALTQGSGIVYNVPPLGIAPQDDESKWGFFTDFSLLPPSLATPFNTHLYLRRLTWESSPTVVYTEPNTINYTAADINYTTFGHAVDENTFWWNRMFVLDENFNIITNEIDLANFVAYDSGHTPLVTIYADDPDVRDTSSDTLDVKHANLQVVRETRYGGSDLTYEAKVMSQGVLFFNREGKLPNMFVALNAQHETDGVLRDFRTLYLDEIPNGIFKTAPYFTLDEYANNNCFDKARIFNEMLYVPTPWNDPTIQPTLDVYYSAEALLQTFYDDLRADDLANPRNRVQGYNVKDELNTSDVIKAFYPLTSDTSPVVNIDNILLDSPSAQVTFCSPSLANLDRDYLFPHDGELVWQDDNLAVELPFIFSPELVIYYPAGQNPTTLEFENKSAPVLSLINVDGNAKLFAVTPVTPFARGAIGKFNNADLAYRPVIVTNMANNSGTPNYITDDAAYAPIRVFAKAYELVRLTSSLDFDIRSDINDISEQFGFYDANGFFQYVGDFKDFVTTYRGHRSKSENGFFSNTSSDEKYSFKIYSSDGGSGYSVIATEGRRYSKAIGFNANNYFSTIEFFDRRIYLASKEAPEKLLFTSLNDYLDFSTVSALVNSPDVAAVTRGGRTSLDGEAIEVLYKANDSMQVITNERIVTVGADENGAIILTNPSDIATAGKAPITLNNFTYFISGDNRDILLSVFSEKTQRYEYYSVFTALNIDDETEIIQLLPIVATYHMVVQTSENIYIGTILEANRVAWAKLEFNFDVLNVSSDSKSIYLHTIDSVYALIFTGSTDIEDDTYASFKLLAPTALANLVNLPKTNINYKGMRLHDITLVGTFTAPVRTGSDERKYASTYTDDVVDVCNKNYNDIYDSIEFSFKGGQNRVIYLRGSLGV